MTQVEHKRNLTLEAVPLLKKSSLKAMVEKLFLVYLKSVSAVLCAKVSGKISKISLWFFQTSGFRNKFSKIKRLYNTNFNKKALIKALGEIPKCDLNAC